MEHLICQGAGGRGNFADGEGAENAGGKIRVLLRGGQKAGIGEFRVYGIYWQVRVGRRGQRAVKGRGGEQWAERGSVREKAGEGKGRWQMAGQSSSQRAFSRAMHVAEVNLRAKKGARGNFQGRV